MTERGTTLVQARVPRDEARQLDRDAAVLGLASRSEAVREGLRLLHRRARDAALAASYDDFYRGREAPPGDLAQVGDEVAAETVADRERAG